MSVYPDSDKVSGPEGILLRSSAVGYWHGEGTAGPSEPVEIVREPKRSPPQPAVNALALRADAAEPHAPAGFRYRAAKLGPLLGADRLDGTVVDLDPGEGSEPYHYVYGREEWLLVLAGTPTLRHPHGEDQLEAGDLVCLPEGRPVLTGCSIAASRWCARSCAHCEATPATSRRSPARSRNWTGRQDRPPTRLLQRPPQPANDPRQAQLPRSPHDLARQARAAPAAAQLLGARRSATRAGRPALGRHVRRDQPSGRSVRTCFRAITAPCPVHSLHRQAERATVPGDAFESSPSYVRFSRP